MRKAWIRVDANKLIGRGHLSRCMALAEMLKSEFHVTFLIKKENKMYCQPLLVEWQTNYVNSDLEMTSMLSANDMLIVDSYAIDNQWRSHFKQFVGTLVDINDIPGEIRGADVILNHCPGINKDQYVTDDDTEFLLGLDFAILRKPFLEYALSNSFALVEKGIFICFGGADPYHLGIDAANEILTRGFSDPIYLVTNYQEELTQPLSKFSNFFLLNDLSADEMRDYMLQSRLLYISASVLSFEAIALRKPMIVLYYVDNQKRVYEGLVKLGLAKGYSLINNLKLLSDSYRQVEKLYNSNQELLQIIQKQMQVLDGSSNERIRQKLSFLNI